MANVVEQKEWWQSRTVWTGAIAALAGLAHAAGLIPAPLSNGVVEESATVILGLLTIYFRIKAERMIAPVLAETPPQV